MIIRYGQTTDDEVFISHDAATAGVEIENNGSEPLVGLRYFGPDTWDQVPAVGDHRTVASQSRFRIPRSLTRRSEI